jgi:hypothetical protein
MRTAGQDEMVSCCQPALNPPTRCLHLLCLIGAMPALAFGFLRAVRLAHRAFRIVRLDRGRHDRQHFGKSGGPFDEHVKIHDLAIEGFTPCCGVVAFRVSLS